MFMGWKRTRSCLMTLDGSVKEHLRHIQSRKIAPFQIFMAN